MDMYIHEHTHMYIHIYIYIYVCLCGPWEPTTGAPGRARPGARPLAPSDAAKAASTCLDSWAPLNGPTTAA